MSINLEIGDDAVVGTNNDAGGSISMSIILELHIVAVDGTISVDSQYLVFTVNILELDISFIVHITLSLFLSMIFSLVVTIVLTPRFCTLTTIATVFFMYFEWFSSILVFL